MATWFTDPNTGLETFISDQGDWYVMDPITGQYAEANVPGGTTETDWAKVITDAASGLAQGYLTYQSQKAYLEEQARRAKLGQTLLTPQQWGTLGQVTVAPDAATKQMITWAAIGAGVLLLLAMVKR